ncbi:MAG: FMN-binding protein [Hyphomicrobiales bacterium]|nr:FMN-binding protein [Hyphomicrobiales bacterium]
MTKSASFGLYFVACVAVSCTALAEHAEAGIWPGWLSGGPARHVTIRPSQARMQLKTAATTWKDGSYLGPVMRAYYGVVQVKANILQGHLVSVNVLRYPHDRPNSRRINHRALPLLQREVIKAQGTRVDIVSGATLTSRAYLRSLSKALSQASQ